MKPEHIKEAIPSLGERIKFENLYTKFLSDEVLIVDEINQNHLQEMDALNTDNNMDLDQISDQILISLEKEVPKISEVMFANAPKQKNNLRTPKVLLLF